MLNAALYGAGLFVLTLVFMRFAGPTKTFEWKRSLLVGVLGALGHFLFLSGPPSQAHSLIPSGWFGH